MRTEGGAAGFAEIAAELIRVTFGADASGEERDGQNPPQPQGGRSPGTR